MFHDVLKNWIQKLEYLMASSNYCVGLLGLSSRLCFGQCFFWEFFLCNLSGNHPCEDFITFGYKLYMWYKYLIKIISLWLNSEIINI